MALVCRGKNNFKIEDEGEKVHKFLILLSLIVNSCEHESCS